MAGPNAFETLDPRNGLPAWDVAGKVARVVNDPAELEAEFKAGRVSLVTDHEYPMVGKDGKVWAVPGSGVDQALKERFRIASAAEVARAHAESAGSQLRTVVDGALDGATFGGGSAIQAGMGVDKLDLQARREVNPGLHALGAVGGTVALALASDGASLGGLAEVGVARAIGTEAAATTLGRMGATAVGGAVEGAAYSVGDTVSEAVLGDAPLAAESLIASGAHGAMWGGATGALLGKVLGRRPEVGKLRPTAEEINAAATKALGDEVPKGYGQAMLDFLDRSGAKNLKAQGAEPELVRVFGEGSAAERKRFLELAQTPKGELDAKTRQLKGALEERLAGSAEFNQSAQLEREALEAKVVKLESDAVVKRERAQGLSGDDAAAAKAADNEAAAQLAEAKALQARHKSDDATTAELRKHFGIDASGKVDEGRLSAFVDTVTRPRADERMAALKSFVGDDAKLAGVVDDIAERQAARNLVRDQVAREGGAGAGEELMATAGGMFAYSAGGFPAAVAAREGIRGLTGSLNRPMATAQARYRLAAQVQRVHKYVRDGLDQFVTRAQRAGRAIELDRKLAPMTQQMLSAAPP